MLLSECAGAGAAEGWTRLPRLRGAMTGAATSGFMPRKAVAAGPGACWAERCTAGVEVGGGPAPDVKVDGGAVRVSCCCLRDPDAPPGEPPATRAVAAGRQESSFAGVRLGACARQPADGCWGSAGRRPLPVGQV